jgi:hypothetical protein
VSLSALHHALRAKDVDQVLAIARRRRVVPLKYAARIVCLLADTEDERYERAATRFLARVIEEYDPPLEQVWRLANCLRFVKTGAFLNEARHGLQRVVGQLHRMERIDIDFKADW